VDYLQVGYEVSARKACEVMQLSRGTYYYESHADPQWVLRVRLRDLAQQYIAYGFRRLHVLLQREGWRINHKRVYRLYVEEGLTLRRKGPRRRRSILPRVSTPAPTGPDQIWSMDFVHDELGWGQRFRILTLVDHFSRVSPALEVGVSMTGRRVADILSRLAVTRGLPEVIRVDNGTEFTSKALDQWAYQHGVKLDFTRPGKPTDNAFIESFNASLRKECLNVHWFRTLDEAKEMIERWRIEYNAVRPHSSLGNLTPGEYVEKHEMERSSETPILTQDVV
jgi:putative transposase